MTTIRYRFRHTLTAAMAALLIVAVCVPRPAAARVRLKDICTIYGEREVKLVGIGLVSGLNGTGDGGKNLPAVRALAAAMKLMHTPVLDFKELKDAKNFAIVWIEATIPKNGARRGQKLDCYITSFLGAKSLRGGRLLPAPLETTEVDDDQSRGTASGALIFENPKEERAAKIPGGVTLTDDFIRDFIDVYRGGIITILLDSAHVSFQAASEVARVVNNEFDYPGGSEAARATEPVARATGPGVVEIRLPQEYQDFPVEFVSDVLEVRIESPNTQARVIVNNKTGVILFTENVGLSPTVITHKNLVVEINNQNPQTGGFVALTNSSLNQSSELRDLVEVMNRLKVPAEDRISIIRALHKAGSLHAEYIEQ